MSNQNIKDILNKLKCWNDEVRMPKVTSEPTIHLEMIECIDEFYKRIDMTMAKVNFMRYAILREHGKYITSAESKNFHFLMTKYDSIYVKYTNLYNWCTKELLRISTLLKRNYKNIPEDLYSDIDSIINYISDYDDRVNTSILPSFAYLTILRYCTSNEYVKLPHSSISRNARNDYYVNLVEEFLEEYYIPIGIQYYKLDVVTNLWNEAVRTGNEKSLVHPGLFERVMKKVRTSTVNCYLLFMADEDGDVHYVNNGGVASDLTTDAEVLSGDDTLEFVKGMITTHYDKILMSAIKLN